MQRDVDRDQQPDDEIPGSVFQRVALYGGYHAVDRLECLLSADATQRRAADPMMVATTKPLRIPGLKYVEPETPLGMKQFVGPVPPTPLGLPCTPPEIKQVKVFSPHTPPEILAAVRNEKSIPLPKTPPTPPLQKQGLAVVADGTTMPQQVASASLLDADHVIDVNVG